MHGRAHLRALQLDPHRRDAEEEGQLGVRARAGACAMRRPQEEPDSTRGDEEASAAHNSTLRARATAEELREPARAHNAVGPGARKKQGCREGARGGPQWIIGPRRLTPAGGRGRRTHCQHAHTAHPKRSPSVAVMTSQHDAVARAGCGRLLHRVDVLEPRRAGRERVELGVAALADDCSRAGYRSHSRARMRALRFGTEPAVWGLLSVMWTA